MRELYGLIIYTARCKETLKYPISVSLMIIRVNGVGIHTVSAVWEHDPLIACSALINYKVHGVILLIKFQFLQFSSENINKTFDHFSNHHGSQMDTTTTTKSSHFSISSYPFYPFPTAIILSFHSHHSLSELSLLDRFRPLFLHNSSSLLSLS